MKFIRFSLSIYNFNKKELEKAQSYRSSSIKSSFTMEASGSLSFGLKRRAVRLGLVL
jgi:hypothetical protein